MNHPATRCRSVQSVVVGASSGYWFNCGGESSATVQINADGTILVATGSPDIGGSLASIARDGGRAFGVDTAMCGRLGRRPRLRRLPARPRGPLGSPRETHGGAMLQETVDDLRARSAR